MVAQNDDQNASMILYKLLLTIHKRAGFKTSMLQNHKKIFESKYTFQKLDVCSGFGKVLSLLWKETSSWESLPRKWNL